jgi:hypothetical protein
LYLVKPLVTLNIKECLSLDLLNFVSIDDFSFYMRWGNACVTSLNHIMDTVIKNFMTFEKIKTLIKKQILFFVKFNIVKIAFKTVIESSQEMKYQR